MAERLRESYGHRARIMQGDGTATGLPAGEFSSVVCFTMLHHIPTVGLQDQLFAEAFRVLRQGGVFAGSDSASSIPFRVLHFRDICNPVSPQGLPNRLRASGFSDVGVDIGHGSLRWRAVKPPRKCNQRDVYSRNGSAAALSRRHTCQPRERTASRTRDITTSGR
jgi:SAM-dependent methyltransferase